MAVENYMSAFDQDNDGEVGTDDIASIIASGEDLSRVMVTFDTPEEQLAWVIEVRGDDDGVFDENEVMAFIYEPISLLQAEYDK